MGATGFEPVTSSVSGTAGRWRRPALSGRMWLANRQEAGPLLTVVVRCNPVVRGPDVALMWPQRSRAWKAHPVPSSRPAASPMPQVRASVDRPVLSAIDRQRPMLRARGGHGRRGSTALQRGGDGHKLNRRVRPVPVDHLPRWQALRRRARPATPVGCSELSLLEVALAFPARRERDGAEFKERQGGLPGIVRAHKVPLWDGRELVAKLPRPTWAVGRLG